MDHTDESPAVLFNPTFNSEDDTKETLNKLFPNQIPIFESTGRSLLAIIEDFDSDRFLIVRAHGWDGSLSIISDNLKLKPPFDEERVDYSGRLLGPIMSLDKDSRMSSHHLGYWIPHNKDKILTLVADLEYPEPAHISVAYSPDSGWTGSISLK